MNYLATITSKNQLTLPIALVRKTGLRVGQKIAISEEAGRLILTPAEKLVEELAGSIKIPPRLRGVPFEKALKIAKQRYFAKKYGLRRR